MGREDFRAVNIYSGINETTVTVRIVSLGILQALGYASQCDETKKHGHTGRQRRLVSR